MALLGQISSGSALTFDPRLKVAAGASPADDVIITVTGGEAPSGIDILAARNGNFNDAPGDDPSNFWSPSDNAFVLGGVGVFDTEISLTPKLRQQLILENGKSYQVTFDLVTKTAGTGVEVVLNAIHIGVAETAGQTYVFSGVSSGTTLQLWANGGFEGTIDNVVVEELITPAFQQTWAAGEDSEKTFTDEIEIILNGDFSLGDNGDWIKGAGVTITDKANATAASSILCQNNVLTAGETYVATWDYTETASKSLRIENEGNIVWISDRIDDTGGSGSLYAVFTAVATGDFCIEAELGVFTGTLDNFTVQKAELPAGTYDVTVDQPDLIEQFDSPSDNWASLENTTLETMDLLTVFDMENNDLLTANVDGILSSLIVNEALRPSVTADIVLSGTNEAPSDAGMTNAYSLVILADWTVDVTVNSSAVQISTQDEVEAIDTDSETLTWNYDQTADIAATGTWDVIGDDVNIFSGIYDGQGHTIDGLTNTDALNGTAMFHTNSGTIQNLGLTNVNIIGGTACGALVGNNGGNVSECFSTGAVAGVRQVGGLIGSNSNPVDNCYSRASVTASIEEAGGFAGVSIHSITNSYATGAVSAPLDAGGFVGVSPGIEADCFWDTQTSGQATSGGSATGKLTSEMQTQSTFTGVSWNFSTIWSMDGYPVLVVFDKQIGLFPGTGLFPKTPLMPTQGLFPNKGLYP